MRFSVQLPTERVEAPEEFLGAAAIGEMASAAERAGFDACYVTDHPIPDARWLAAGGHHALDPFVALSLAAAATRSLRLQTHVLVLPYRNPFLTAKAAASLDAASSGRLLLGVSAGYQQGELRALGVDPEERNALCDEAIAILKRVWSGDVVSAEGRHFSARGNAALPRPAQRPRPPIWVGGNSRRAIRRAVELADGWLPFPAQRDLARSLRTGPLENLDDLRELLVYARAHAERVGRRDPLDVCLVPFGLGMLAPRDPDPEALLAELPELEALGVTWLAVSLPCASRAEYCDRLAAFGERILAPARSG